MKKILSESGHERNRNAGDEAYFATMVVLFRKLLGDVEISAFSDRPERDRSRYDVDTIYSGGTLFGTLKNLFCIINAIRRCDVYVWGAGQLLRDDTGIKSPLYRLSRPVLAKLLGKPVMAYAIGIGPIGMKMTRFLSRHVLNLFDLITVRDEFSRELLEQIGVNSRKIHVTIDPAFALTPSPKKEIDTLLSSFGMEPANRPLIGVAPFGPAFRGVRSILPVKYQVKRDIWQPNGEQKYDHHVSVVAQACDYVAEKYKARCVFIAQDCSWQGRDDKIVDDIISRMKNQDQTICLNADDYPPSLLQGLMGRMEFVMGGRMHSLIIASGINTPVLGICFEQKIKSFGEVIGQPKYFIDESEIKSVDDLLTVIEQICSNRHLIRSELETRVNQLKQKVESNVMLLGELLGNHSKSDSKTLVSK